MNSQSLPVTGRGTMRSMVEGQARRSASSRVPLHPAASGVAVPLPVPGRNA
jgi:hypothetical protein